MSFDLSNLSAKDELATPPAAPAPPSPTVVYERRKTQLEARLERQLRNSASLPLRVRIGFLTEQDKTALDTALQAKGYTCTMDEFGRFMTLS